MAPIPSFVSRTIAAALVCMLTGPLASNQHALGLNPSQEQQASPAPAVIAVAFPSDAQPGETITGTVTADPKEIEEIQQIPGLHVTLYPVPKPAQQPSQPAAESQAGNTLEGVVVEVNGERQPANKPLIARLGPEAASIVLRLVTNESSPRLIGGGNVPIGGKPLVHTIPTQTPSAAGCDMPTVTTPGAVQVIHGPSTGNANDMHITVDDKPARIIAATPRSVFWTVPLDLPAGSQTNPPGAHQVVFSRKVAEKQKKAEKQEKQERATFLMYAFQMKLRVDSTHLARGQSTPMHVTITGLEKLPPSAWESAMPSPDLVDVNKLKERGKDLKAPKPNEPGAVVVVIENQTPNVIRLGRHNVITLALHQQDFAHGPYTYNDRLQSLHGGNFIIHGMASAFLKTTQGRAANQGQPDNAAVLQQTADSPVGNPPAPGPSVPEPKPAATPLSSGKGPCPCEDLCRAAVSAEVTAQGKLEEYERLNNLVETMRGLIQSLEKSSQQDSDLAQHYEGMGGYKSEAERLRKEATDLQVQIHDYNQKLKELEERQADAAEKYRTAATEAAAARAKCDDCLAEHPECPRSPWTAGGFTTEKPPDPDAPYLHVPDDSPPVNGPKNPTGDHDLHRNDKTEDCPERHHGCIALYIDLMKNDPATRFFQEWEARWKRNIATARNPERKSEYEDSLRQLPKRSDFRSKLKNAGCEVDYEEPDFWPLPAPVTIEAGGRVSLAPAPAVIDAVKSHNAAEQEKLFHAITQHHAAVSRSKPEVAIEILDGHGAGVRDLAFDPRRRCGHVSPGYETGAGGKLFRADFHEGNYKAANKNVCSWFTLDLSCYGGLTPKVVDELDNLTTSTCKAASVINCGNHAGWEADGSMASATAITECTYRTAYLQEALLAAALDRQAARNPGGGNPDLSGLIAELKRAERGGTSFYSDRGYAKDHPPIHTHVGYPAMVTPAQCPGGRCGR